ncbi:bifunctional glycoside hydrolase 114/ polysaccharide deacetylase family protein [Legionella israelensis]|nr:endo alpha-1,4 polygalactosaminidase [Legionella israelensis]
MKKSRKIIFSLFIMLAAFNCYALNMSTRAAFYYGNQVPFDELHAFEVVVVQPNDNISPQRYNTDSSELYAYVSVGEVSKQADYSSATKRWRKGENPLWDSDIMDLANPQWRHYLIENIINPAWEKGYRGFFLDTLDSYQRLNLTKTQARQQQAGIVDLVKTIKAKHPKARVILNRGFEVLDQIHAQVDAVAAESMFNEWDAGKKIYRPVRQKDRDWLTKTLNRIKKDYLLPIIVIDYVPPQQRQKTRHTAEKIKEAGFIPWVADAHLETLGIGLVEVIPRKILLLYQHDPLVAGKPVNFIKAFDYAAFPLQYMGFIPELQRADSSLPEGVLTDRYAGVIAWFDKPVIKQHKIVGNWLKQQIKNGLPIVFMQNFGLPLDASLLNLLSLNARKETQKIDKVFIRHQDPIAHYEIMPQPLPSDFQSLTVKTGRALLSLSANGKQEDAIALTPWGGYVLAPFDIVVLSNAQSRWVINPFVFFHKALRLPEIPIPDVTSASGRRILTVHIDGDAFISRVPWLEKKYTGDVLYEQILKRYPVPTTVSLIQREFELLQPYPALQKHMMAVAKNIFSLPWVDIATHTYSHPLQWGKLVEGQSNMPYLSYPSKNYQFNYEKEITGSARFINQNLAPPNKKVRAVFWSGDANLREKPLQIAYQNHLKNINGMAKIYLKSSLSATNLGAFGVFLGPYFHIFSPIPNDYEYTSQWTPPLYRFQNVIHTFELTDKPHRYKPISIYYHFYSAVDQGALRALKRIYQWALQQQSIPLQIVDYISKVTDFNHTIIARPIDSPHKQWLITNNKSLNEFRRPLSDEKPDIDKSRNVAGYTTHNKDYYIHLAGEGSSWLRMSRQPSMRPYLVDANAEIAEWHIIKENRIRFALKGYVPLRFRLANAEGCDLMQGQNLLKTTHGNLYYLKDVRSGTFEIRCQKKQHHETAKTSVFLWVSDLIYRVYHWVSDFVIPWKLFESITDPAGKYP